MTRVFVIDDHPLLRQGITQLINNEPDLTVCGEAANPESALERIIKSDPDVVVLDISLRGSSGIDLLYALKAHNPDRKVLILSMHDETIFAQRALVAGASGYILKQEATENVLVAIRTVGEGKCFMSPEMATRMRHRFIHDGSAYPGPSDSHVSFKQLNAA